MWIESCFLSWSGKVKLSLLLQWLINKASNWLINKNKLIINKYVKKFRLVTTCRASTCYNPWQNYSRKFSPSCPLSYATKLFPKRRLCGKKTPSPNSMLLPTNAQGSGFLLNTQHYFQGKGEREEPVQLQRLEKCFRSIQFSQQFCPRL